MATLEQTTDYGLEYSWKLTGLRKVDTNGLESVIIGTNWVLTGSDINGISGSFTGATPFKVENLNTASFTTYNELNEETVINWVKGEVTSYWDHINTQILKQIRDNTSPVVVISENDLPWSPISGSVADVEVSGSIE